MTIADLRRQQPYSKADFKEAGLWLLASLCHPLAYLRWYRFNRGRIEAVFPGLLISVTLGILGLIYLDFPMLFRAAPASLSRFPCRRPIYSRLRPMRSSAARLRQLVVGPKALTHLAWT